MNFVPLHVNTSYSILSSCIKLDDLMMKLKKENISSCAITDQDTLLGFPNFYNICKKNNIKPLFGLDLIIDNNKFTLLIKNELGYKNLIKLSYIKNIKSENLNFDDVKKYLNNIVLIISTQESDIFNNPFDSWPFLLKKYSELLKDDFYIGLEFYSPNDKNNEVLRGFLKKYPFNYLAFPHIKYINPQDAITIEIQNCIKEKFTYSLDINKQEDIKRVGKNYFMSEEKIKEIYNNEELINTLFLTSKLNFNFNIKRGKILRFSTNQQQSSQLIKSICYEKLKQLKLDNNHNYVERLNYELDVIDRMGYNDYFLIVQDYVNYAKNNDILVAPGRGSAAGSLVSYLLNITEVDPLKYDLLFERFLNIDRVSMPDIDIDFENTKRDLVVSYLKNKYGQDRVCQIVTIQTLKANQSIRDIGRVYKIPQEHIDNLCKNLDDKLTLKQSYEKNPKLRNFVNQGVNDKNDYYLRIFYLAQKIEGLPRQLGIHAAGVVLNDEKIIDDLPLIYSKEFNINLSQYEMNNLEQQGFLKMDLLALKNLSTIHFILDLIKKNKNIALKFEDIPIDEPEIYSKLINKGLTMGLFQLESDGINNAISIIQPNCFNDIVATIALFRPGPMQSIPLYAERKHNLEKDPNYKINYYSNDLYDILKSTYGIIIYQEQILQICQKVAGFSLSKADIFRRAISKKKISEIEKLKKDFIEGCLKNHYSYELAVNFYNLIEKFAGYGFNKSHSVSYSMITTRLAYLKLKYPEEFYIALLQTTNNSNDDKFKKFIDEITLRNIKLGLPDINLADNIFVLNNNQMIMPFSSIKGLNMDTREKILFERKNHGQFKSFFDFIERIYEYKVSQSQIQKLIEAGCFDSFIKNRNALLDKIELCIKYANVTSKTGNLFDESNENEIQFDENIYENKFQKIINEIKLLGIAISDNPLKYTINDANKRFKNHIIDIKDLKLNEVSYIHVYISRIKKSNKDPNKITTFLSVFDINNTTLDCIIFNDTRLAMKDYSNLAEDKIVTLKGTLSQRNDKKSFIVEQGEIMEIKENE